MKTKGGRRAPARKAPAAGERVFRLAKPDGGLAYLRASQVIAVDVEELEDGDVVTAYLGPGATYGFRRADAAELLEYFEALAAGKGREEVQG